MTQTFLSWPATMTGIGTPTVKLSPCSCFRPFSSPPSFSFKPSILPMLGFPGTTPRRTRFPKIFAFSSNDIKVGSNIEVDGAPWKVIEEADIFKETKQFTYKDGAQFVFMDLTTYEEYRLNASDVGDKEKWLKEGMDCNLLFWKGKVIDFDLPITVKLTVVEVDPGLRGDTAQGGSKPATLDTGAIVNVPLFIEKGQEIMVDTRSGQYMSRA